MRKFKTNPQKKLIGMAILFVFIPLFLLWYWVFFLGHKPGTDTMVILACVAALAAFLYLRYKKQLAKAQAEPAEGEELPEEGEGLPEEEETEPEEGREEEAEEDEGEESLDEAGEYEAEEDDFSEEEEKPVKAKAKTAAKKRSGKGKK